MTTQERIDEAPKKTRHKRCWLCGNRLYGGRGHKLLVGDMHEVDVHKLCKELHEREDE